MSPRMLPLLARCVLASVGLLLCASLRAAPNPAASAIVHVSVVPMDRERVLADETVLIEGGVITAVGRDVRVPAGAQIIDGRGKYLSPGLADMHSHSNEREDMKVYLANGVTTILNLGDATPSFMDQLVPLLNRGERPGPHVYAALRIDGTPQYGQLVVTNPEEARAAVRLAKRNGYTFMKAYNNLSAASFAAMADEARRLGLGVTGHNVEAVRIPAQLDQGQLLVAHLEEMIYGLYTPPEGDPLAPPPNAMIAEMVDLLKRYHAFIVADLFTFQTIAAQWGQPDVHGALLKRPEARYVAFAWRSDWIRSDLGARSGSPARRAAFLRQLVRSLNDNKVGLLAGTDAPTLPGIVAGFSLHDALDRLVTAGLTRFDALSAATREPGEYIRQTIHDEPPFGEVRPGYRADLVLSDANPLDDLKTLRRPAAVISHGRWYGPQQLVELLNQVSADYSREAGLGSEPAGGR